MSASPGPIPFLVFTPREAAQPGVRSSPEPLPGRPGKPPQLCADVVYGIIHVSDPPANVIFQAIIVSPSSKRDLLKS